jgi:hypothetical protein
MPPIQRTGLPTVAPTHHDLYVWTVRLDEHPTKAWVDAFLKAMDTEPAHALEVTVMGRRVRYTSDLDASPAWLQAIDRWIAEANRRLGS